MSRRPSKSKPSRVAKSPRNPVHPARDGLLALTPREREVLGWIAEGKRDAEIGTILDRSVRTVHKHVQHILRKLDTETRTGAARLALEAGLDGKGRDGRGHDGHGHDGARDGQRR